MWQIISNIIQNEFSCGLTQTYLVGSYVQTQAWNLSIEWKKCTENQGVAIKQ